MSAADAVRSNSVLMAAAFESGHFVQFFSTDERLVRNVCQFIRDGLETDCTCIVAGTREHLDAFEVQLRAWNLDPRALAAEYRYIAIDARRLLANFMKDGQPDRDRFHRDADQLLRQAAARGRPIRVFGEMVGLLLEDGLAGAALQLEELWNELSRQHHTFSLFCAYPLSLARALQSQTFRHLCAVHSHVFPAD